MGILLICGNSQEGKIESGESSEEALIREIKEELELDINIMDFLATVE